MKLNTIFRVTLLSFALVSSAYAATPAQCYLYFTQLVRSSSFPFSEWGVTPDRVNLLIDEDNDAIIRAKLYIDTDGSGTLGWVVFNKHENELYNITIDPDKPVVLRFNKEYAKAQKYCLSGERVFQVMKKGRLYLFTQKEWGFGKTNVFVVMGDYVQVLKQKQNFSYIRYETATGESVNGWVNTSALREIDFENSW